MQIQGKILSQDLSLENIGQQFPVAWTKQDHVMRHALISAVCAEIPKEQPHRIARPIEPAVGPAPAMRRRQQLAVGPGGIRIRNDDIGRDRLAGYQPHAGGGALFHRDLGNLCVAAQLAALALDQANQPLHQPPGSAHGKMHPPTPLQEGDQAVDAARAERVAADQQRMEAEHHAQTGIADVFRDQAINAAIALQSDQIWYHPYHVAQRPERDMTEFLEPDPADGFAQLHEALIARDIGRAEFGHLSAHGVCIAGAIEDDPIVESDAIKRRDRPQLDVIGQPAAAQVPQLLEQERCGDDRRAGIEGEAVLAVDIGPAARCIQFLQDRHPVAARAQPNRCRETTETAAYDNRMRLYGACLHPRRSRQDRCQ